ncbi:MAG: HAD hydrolase family protein [Desulfamplus sp.]|nr:HAD hydrolase family protein [Desulfamplus sp.]
MNNRPIKKLDALVCDLDGTLLHSQKEAIAVEGRTRASFISQDAALVLSDISQIFPIVIATGRNSASVYKLVRKLPNVKFSGFVLENGFVAKNKIDDESTLKSVHDWDKIASLFPEWERLPFYENCVGFVFNFDKNDIDRGAIDLKLEYAKSILEQNGYNYPVYKEIRKIFIYPDHVDKMKGLALLGINPYIVMGDGTNDIQIMEQSTFAITLSSGASKLKEIVNKKNGFCSMQEEHNAAFEMLEFAYNKIKGLLEIQKLSG